MESIKRYIVIVSAVSVLFAMTGVIVYVIVPLRLEERADLRLTDTAASLADLLQGQVAEAAAGGQAARIASLIQGLFRPEELSYIFVTDPEDRPIASVRDNGMARLGGIFPDPSDPSVVLAARELTHDDREVGTVYVALRRSNVLSRAKTDRRLALLFSSFLLLVAAGSLFGVAQMLKLREAVEEWEQRHRSLRRRTGSLQSSVKVHKQTEQALRQSEEKYKSLFQSAMASAMRELEDFNKHLETRKAELEQEVGVRQRAEETLRRYANRLQLLNEVERSMLEGQSLGRSVDISLKRLIDLVPVAEIGLFEVSAGGSDAIPLGRAVGREGATSEGFALEPEDVAKLADGSSEIRLDLDLQDSGDSSPMATQLLAAGMRSSCVVPLVVEDETVGLLLLADIKVSAFDDEALDIARDMADLMAMGIRQARMNSERERYELELISAKERAEEMARLKSAFLTNMSHEIRTPIAGIMGFAQVLNDEAPEELREFTGLIQEAANRLLNTINSVLELARLESGRRSMHTDPINFCQIVTESVRLIEPLAIRKGIAVRMEVSEAEIGANLDRASVERIVNNLVGNAIKFTEQGYVRVSVEADARHVRLLVQDTGVGISEDFIPRLFDEFRQEQMESNREHEGSGLGMAITKKLVDRMGGFIDVESHKGAGSLFTVQFPRNAADSKPEPSKRGEVLVVSPHADSAHLLREKLEPDWTCTEAPSLEQAVVLANHRAFDGAVIDVNGLGPSEYHLLDELRSAGPGIRLLGVATQILPENSGELESAGFDSVVHDPFGGNSLAEALENGDSTDRAAVRRHHRGGPSAMAQGADETDWKLA